MIMLKSGRRRSPRRAARRELEITILKSTDNQEQQAGETIATKKGKTKEPEKAAAKPAEQPKPEQK